MIKPEQFNYFSTYLIAEEAVKRGIEVEKIFRKGTLAKGSQVIFKYKKHQEIVVGQRTSQTDCIAYWIQKNKHLAKYFFEQAGLSVSRGEVFRSREADKIIKFCNRIKYPVVIKPLHGIQGKRVFVGINSERQVKKILKNFKRTSLIVEKEFKGEEYRIFATKDKFVAAVHRVPANVVGDGIHTIKELVEIKNKDPRRGDGHKKSLVKIKIDSIVKDFLKKQKLRLTYVPKKNEIIYLRSNSNISTGGDSYDVTNIVHPQIKKMAVKIIRAIPGLAYAGIDYLTKNILVVPTKRNYIIIEVNDSPMISMHHVPYSGEARNVAKEIVDQIFPETKKNKQTSYEK